jgi:phosphate transport system permease protein
MRLQQRRERRLNVDMTHINEGSHLSSPAQSSRPRRNSGRRAIDALARVLSGLAAGSAALLVALFTVLLLQRAWPLLIHQPLTQLLGGTVWAPHKDLFGFAPFIAGSVAVTLVAMLLAVAPAVLSGIYLAEYTSARTRALLKPMLDLLVGVPPVIFGLWGVLVIVPFIRDLAGPFLGDTLGQSIPFFLFKNTSGYSVLAAGSVLAVMVFPLIVAVVDEVLRSTPQEMREALLSLGATKWEATRCIVRRRGLTGVIAAVVLGFSRAFGETLAVLMVVGNVTQVPHSLFDAAYPLPALIANNYGEMMSIPLYESALMGAALLLLITVIVFNITARAVIVRIGKGA